MTRNPADSSSDRDAEGKRAGLALVAEAVSSASGRGVWAVGGNTGLVAEGPNGIRAFGGSGGWAGVFENRSGNGVITTPAGTIGLQVVGSTKNAVVGTTSGARALYTEESSEVWFTDYGFGRLEHGRARILIDPTSGLRRVATSPLRSGSESGERWHRVKGG